MTDQQREARLTCKPVPQLNATACAWDTRDPNDRTKSHCGCPAKYAKDRVINGVSGVSCGKCCRTLY